MCIVRLGLIFMFFCLSGCLATSGTVKSQTDNYISKFAIGAVANDLNDKLVVARVAPDTAAEKAGLKTGDIILSVDGKKVNCRELFKIIMNKNQGEHVFILVKRNDKIINFDIEPNEIRMPPSYIAIYNLLENNKKIALAVIVTQVRNNVPGIQHSQLKQWEESMTSGLISKIENDYIEIFKGTYDTSFSIVDRSKLGIILNEVSFNQSGLVSDNLRTKIGEITGATHLLLVDLSRYPERHFYTDLFNSRLIEIITGEVVAVGRKTGEFWY